MAVSVVAGKVAASIVVRIVVAAPVALVVVVVVAMAVISLVVAATVVVAAAPAATAAFAANQLRCDVDEFTRFHFAGQVRRHAGDEADFAFRYTSE